MVTWYDEPCNVLCHLGLGVDYRPHFQLRHAYNVLIDQVGTEDSKKVKEVQMKLMRHGDERTNNRSGKSPPPLRQPSTYQCERFSDRRDSFLVSSKTGPKFEPGLPLSY